MERTLEGEDGLRAKLDGVRSKVDRLDVRSEGQEHTLNNIDGKVDRLIDRFIDGSRPERIGRN